MTDDSHLYWQASVDRRWRLEAACYGQSVELFFSDRGADAKNNNLAAKAICQTCPVRFSCLHDAMLEPQPWFGIRGGLTAKERRKLKWRPRNA